MTTQVITRDEVRNLIASLGNTFASVTYVSRQSGETRSMVITGNFANLLKGGESKYDATAKGLIIVRRIGNRATRGGIRSVGIEGVKSIKVNGNLFTVAD